jgi:predicted nucleic acid-binding protein
VRLALDTKVMAYVEGMVRTTGDIAKNALALRLVAAAASDAFVVAAQSLGELHNVLVRKRRLGTARSLEPGRALAARSELVATDANLLTTSLHLAADHNLQVFDAIILAAAAGTSCAMLLSEDLHDGFAWRGVTITNPFGPSPDPRLTPLLAGP